MWRYVYQDELYHHGVKGMKWGVRRYQNSDGSLTSAGKKRYASDADGDRSTASSGKKRYASDADSDRALKSRIKDLGDSDGWSNLFNEIQDKSGDWYSGKGVSTGFKRVLKEYESEKKALDKKFRTDAEEKAIKANAEIINYKDKKLKELRTNSLSFQKAKENYDNYKSALDKETERYREQYGEDVTKIPKKERAQMLVKLVKMDKLRNKFNDENDKIVRQVIKDPQFNKLREDYWKAAELARQSRQTNSKERHDAERKLKNKLKQSLSSVVLQDLGYRDTEAGRNFLLEHDLIFYD